VRDSARAMTTAARRARPRRCLRCGAKTRE
jgi:hypothetical protein